MTRLAVGPSWANLNPAQQQQLIAAFGHYVAATYADQFDTYSGEQLQVTGERPHGAGVVVETKIVKSNGDVTRLDYLTRQGCDESQGFLHSAAVPRTELEKMEKWLSQPVAGAAARPPGRAR